MHFVYILRSLSSPEKRYVGQTTDIDARLDAYNAGSVISTRKHKPWKVETYIAFDDSVKAFAFERYLKSGSGRAFSAKRF